MTRKYPFALDEPLLWFGERAWTIRDSLDLQGEVF
jgi:hypothetical protein